MTDDKHDIFYRHWEIMLEQLRADPKFQPFLDTEERVRHLRLMLHWAFVRGYAAALNGGPYEVTVEREALAQRERDARPGWRRLLGL